MDGPTPTRVLTPLDVVQARIAARPPLGRVETVPPADNR